MTEAEKLRKAGVRTAVLCGGPGGEREVSLASGENASAALRRAGVLCETVIVPAERPERCLESLDCDVAVMMLHGEFGEDGTAQAILDRRGIAYTGSGPEACALAMDKNRSKELFVRQGIPTPRWVHAASPEEAETNVREAGLRFPLFVKPNAGGSSVLAGRADDSRQLAAAAAAVTAHGGTVLAEEMVIGRELTVGWLDGRTLPIIEMRAEDGFYDYHAKYISEKTGYVCPADLPGGLTAEISRLAKETAACIGVRDIARTDVMLGEDGPRVLELNALPGFTSHSLVPMAAAAAGMKCEELCAHLAALAAVRAGIL